MKKKLSVAGDRNCKKHFKKILGGENTKEKKYEGGKKILGDMSRCKAKKERSL
ncbi:hypothetical protein [Bartonella sp. AU55XJBT]|uniref:hypothetical protein n=1 Tax=Bartonella sp. AU55XJBT TaxID=3019091 RepID=UPI002362E995|nr:hypothetical protein [Bartonella sp. AU55XJBT]